MRLTGKGFVKWQSSPNGTTWTDISGALSSSYTPPQTVGTIYYRCVATNEETAAYSNSSLYVNSNPVTITYYAVADLFCTAPSCDYKYVSTFGSDVPTAGSSNAPYRTLKYAIDNLGTFTEIRVEGKLTPSATDYPESNIITLKSGITIEGGFQVSGSSPRSWTKNSAYVTLLTLSGEETVSGLTHRIGIKSDAVNNWTIQDINIKTTDVSGQDPNGRGKSNYAVWINNSSGYSIIRSQITSGAAGNGLNGTAPGTAGTGGGAKGTGGNGAGSGNNKGANGAAGTAISGGAAGGTPGGTGGNGCSGGCRAQTGGVGTPGTNGTGFTAGDRPTATLVNAAYFTPSGKSSDGQAGGGGAGGGGGGGSASYGVFGACGGQPGGKGGDGGNGGAGGFGGYGAGGTFGIWRYNSNSSVNITNVIVSTGTAGTGGTGAAGTSGAAGSAGAGGGSNGGVCSSSNGGGTGGAGGKGGDGGRGRDGANGLAAKMVVDGTPSDPSTVIPNPTTVNINYTRTNIPGKACTNSEIDLSKVAGTWSFPSGLSLVNDVTPTTQSYDPSSNNIKVTTVSTGKYDLLVNGEVYANYLKVNTTRNLPVFNSATISICKGGTASFGVNSSFEPSNIAEREWLVYTTSPSSPLFSSSSAGLTTGILNTVGTYIVRYRERHNCCGWSIPVFGQIVVNELPFANNITPIPNQPVICEGVNISADFAGASGGGGTITDEFEISTDGGNNWNNYTVNAGVGSSVSTSGLGGKTVIIRTRRTATGSGCGSTDYNTYSWAIDKFTIANAGTDQLVCGTTATLTANLPAVGAGSWSLQSGSGSIDYSTEAVTTISGLGVGPNVFRWTLDNGFICGDSYDEVTITRDNIAPLLTCKSAILSLDATGNTILSVADVENTASDNCGISTKTLSATNFTCLNVGTNTVTLTETDINGNSSTCTSTVSVLDEIAPVALCQDLIVDLDASPGGMATITGAQINNGSSDVCGISAYTVSPSTFTCANVGTNTVTLTVKDVNNNTSTCTATVTVQDVTIPNVSPVAECLPNVTVSIGKATLTINSGNLDNGSFDNCGFASLTVSPNTFTCSDIGSPITVTLTGTDAAGNSSTCTSQVSIVDEETPDANCKSITVQLDNSGNAVISASDVNNNSTDNCGIASLGININSFNCADIGDKLITLTVTDNYSNASTCNARVTVEDNVSPLAICQNITVQLDNTGNGTTTAVAVDNGSTDACGIQTLSLNKYGVVVVKCC